MNGVAQREQTWNGIIATCEAAIETALETWSNTDGDKRSMDRVVKDALAALYIPPRRATQ